MGDQEEIQYKYIKKQQMMKKLDKISPEIIVKSEELILTKHDIFTEPQY